MCEISGQGCPAVISCGAGVEYAEPNYLIRLLGNYSSDPLLPQQYHLSMIDALDAWKIRTDASPVKVCIIGTPAGLLLECLSAVSNQSGGAAVRRQLLILACTDTGADRSQADLVGNLSPHTFNSVENNTDAWDLNGHGTLVAGIVGARGAGNICLACNWPAGLSQQSSNLQLEMGIAMATCAQGTTRFWGRAWPGEHNSSLARFSQRTAKQQMWTTH